MSSAVRIGLCQGEPGGIGPDLWVETLHRIGQRESGAEFVYIGDVDCLRQRADLLKLPLDIAPLPEQTLTEQALTEQAPNARPSGSCSALHIPLPQPVQAGTADPAQQSQVIEVLRRAVAACMDGALDALCTGPVHKAAIHRAGFEFRGQTGWLAAEAARHRRAAGPAAGPATERTTERAAGRAADAAGYRPLMSFVAGDLRLALATTHLPLSEVPSAITEQGLLADMRTMSRALSEYFAVPSPRLLVCGLNPHAGEQGLLGSEEADIIAPAIARAQDEGIDATGPVAADTAFTPQSLARTDAVLAMYHDQALPVLKHSFFDQAVNLTLGLPFVRTSPDHGTALELAGSGRARPDSTLHAVRLACTLAGRHRAGG